MGQRHTLAIIVHQHVGCDILGHFDQDLVAFRQVQFAVGNHFAQQDLDVYFMIGRCDAGRIVDKVRIDASTAEREFDTAQLGDAQVGTFTDYLAVQLASIDAKGIVYPVACC